VGAPRLHVVGCYFEKGNGAPCWAGEDDGSYCCFPKCDLQYPNAKYAQERYEHKCWGGYPKRPRKKYASQQLLGLVETSTEPVLKLLRFCEHGDLSVSWAPPESGGPRA